MKPLSIILFILLPVLSYSQSRINGWKSHASFTQISLVTETKESIVGATSNGILFVNKDGSDINTKTKVEGLSDADITAIAYSSSQNTLLIGYKNGNLDLIQNGNVSNFPDLLRKNDLPVKTINRIVCEENFAFLCCAFGIVKIDLKKSEVAETWYLGPNSDLKEAFDMIRFNNSWWIATNHGILTAARIGTNLQDYHNWHSQNDLPQVDAECSSFAECCGMLFVHDRTDDMVLVYNGLNWQRQNPEIRNIRSIKQASEEIIVLTNKEVWRIGKSGSLLINSYLNDLADSGIDPKDALTDANGTLWIGDYHFGLTRKSGNTTFQHFITNSPRSDQISALKAGPEDVFAGTVSTSSSGTQEASLSIYQAGIWQNFTGNDDPGLNKINPITFFAFSPDHPDKFWASTSGSGLLFFQKNRISSHYDEKNSALGAINQLCVINGISIDSQNNLWYSNPTGKISLGTRLADGTFVSLAYPPLNFSGSVAKDILTSSSSTIWAVLPEEGLFAFKIKGAIENVSDDQYRKVAVQSRFIDGSTSMITGFNDISVLAEDHHHQLWVGTGTGIVMYSNPDKIFEQGEFYGIQPSINDGEELFKPILEKEKITAIAVDGGNRKWFGTANSGAFLFTENGDRLLQHFNSKNSPMPSDQILSIAISPKSGEVLFATDHGLISFKSNATENNASLDKAYVWPNPLRENYEGGVTIDGLTDGTIIRITDVIGNLIYETSSVGGRAVWNTRNNKGSRVSTGVYLIFCNSQQPRTSKIIKLLVIH